MEGSKLYVGNLKYSVTSEELQTAFGAHGTVTYAKVIEGKGFGFVEMSTPQEAESAREALNGSDFNGRPLRIDEARPPKSKPTNNFRSYNNLRK